MEKRHRSNHIGCFLAEYRTDDHGFTDFSSPIEGDSEAVPNHGIAALRDVW
jgi:hypothetical protein